jgi:hypothetical protein
MCHKPIKTIETENVDYNNLTNEGILNNNENENFINFNNDMDDFEINGLMEYEMSEFDPNQLQIYLPNEHNMTENEIVMIRNVFMMAHLWFTRGHNSTYNNGPTHTVREPL